MKDFFVSYNRADRNWAEWISWQLEDAGYSVVVQAWDFVGNWVLAMDRAMKDTSRTIAVLSPNYLTALYTHPEWADAFRRDPTGNQDLLIPVRVEDLELTGILANIVYVDLVDLDEKAALERLLARVRGQRSKPGEEPAFPNNPGRGGAREPSAKPAYPPRPSTAGATAAPAPAAGAGPGVLHAPSHDWTSPVARNVGPYKVVAFDLDGTLIRGKDFAFSWERVWTELKFAKAVQRELRSAYRRRAETEPHERIAAYRTWCEQAVSRFRQRGLTRRRLAEIAGGLGLTANCRQALGALREAGVVTAIVSGGVHTFLEDCFPDFRDYVDFVFINELTFDAAGVVEGVVASAFDFEGKAEALRLVCDRTGCTREETVFVGDHFNDETIMLHANLAIAYPPTDKIAADTARISIVEDDLTRILPYVLAE